MTSNRLKRLVKFRLILSVIALLLAALMITSGVMLFIVLKPEAPAEVPSRYEDTIIIPYEPEATEDPTESADNPEDSADPDMDPGVLIPQQIEGDEGSHDQGSHIHPPKHPGNTGGNGGNNNGTSGGTGGGTGDNSGTPGGDSGSTGGDSGSTGGDSGNTGGGGNTGSGGNTGGGGSTGGGGGSSDGGGNTGGGGGTTSTPAEASASVTMPGNVPAPEATTSVTEAASDYSTVKYGYTEKNQTTSDEDNSILWGILFWTSTALLAVDLAAILFVSSQIRNEQNRLQDKRKPFAATQVYPQQYSPGAAFGTNHTTLLGRTHALPKVATIHQIGRRDYQQDSSGHTAILGGKGMIAVLADGMGGLSGGEKVSQKIVMDSLSLASKLQPRQVTGVLWKMLDKVNENVNQMLGPDGLYKSGSTIVAVLAYDGQFQWISVGDSRIYLYRQGYANQLNQDHDHLQTQMADVLAGRLTMEEVLRNPDSRKLTSFIGMGQLKYVDGSRNAIALEPGDRLVLMSDGVYNIVNENCLAEVLKNYPDVEQAANVIERIVRDANHPHQDNYTAILLGF